MLTTRTGFEIPFTWAAGATDSDMINIEAGCYGTLLVPAGSELIGKTLQFVAVPQTAGKYAETPLLTTPITLVAGANPLSADAIREAGAISCARLRLNSAVVGAAGLVLLWKS
jgi:hypothetical protein